MVRKTVAANKREACSEVLNVLKKVSLLRDIMFLLTEMTSNFPAGFVLLEIQNENSHLYVIYKNKIFPQGFSQFSSKLILLALEDSYYNLYAVKSTFFKGAHYSLTSVLISCQIPKHFIFNI